MSTKKQNKSTRKQRIWTPEETIAVLEYLRHSVLKGYTIEKPNAKAYYKKFLEHTQLLKDVTSDLVRNKVRNLKSSYIKALKFERETGQGVKENDGDTTFKKVLAKRFPYLHYFEMIWDDRMNVIPPRKDESIQIGPPKAATNDASYNDQMEYALDEIDEPDKDLLNYYEQYLRDDDDTSNAEIRDDHEIGETVEIGDVNQMDEVVIGDTIENLNGSANEEVVIADEIEPVDGAMTEKVVDIDDEIEPADGTMTEKDNDDEIEPVDPKKKPVTIKPVTPSISLASKKLLEKVRLNKDVNTAKGAFETLLSSRSDSLKLKMDLENEKFHFEKFKFLEQQKQVAIRMERDYELRQRELETKRLEAENQKEIRLKELEVEKLKWQAILEKNGMMGF